MRRHVTSFKEAIKIYTANVEQRNKRVGNKYGQLSGISALTSENASKYAMFSAPTLEPVEPPASALGGSNALRNRRGGAAASQVEASAYVAEDFTEEVTFGEDHSGSDAGPIGGSKKAAVASTEDEYDNDKKYGKGKKQAAPSSGSGGWTNTSTGASGGNLRGAAPSSASGPYSRAQYRGAAAGGATGAQQAQAQVQQKARGREVDRYRLQQAEQAESTIAQVRAVHTVWEGVVANPDTRVVRRWGSCSRRWRRW
jgi:hypothetical protein